MFSRCRKPLKKFFKKGGRLVEIDTVYTVYTLDTAQAKTVTTLP